MKTSDDVKEISAALVEAQQAMPAIPFNAENPFYHSKFANLGSVIQTTRPILAKYGLAITQFPTTSETGHIGVTSRLVHKSGQWIEETAYISPPASQTNPAWAAGIIISYLRRYSWSAILGIYADEDTDGEGAGKTPEPELSEEEKELKKVKKSVFGLIKELGGKENVDVVNLIKEHVESGNPNDLESVGIAKTLLARLNEMQKPEEKE